MKIAAQFTDHAILRELGVRLAAARLDCNLTQAVLALKAGVSKRTVERFESGEAALQLSSFMRVCRALGLVERLDALIPEPVTSPIAQLKLQGRRRKRASGQKAAPNAPKKWTWGEPP